MVRSKRTAFTLVELLVVITIIGMLMAILLPAVGAATESARAAQCKNRAKNLALAMVNYESRNQGFPGYIDGAEDNDRNMIPYSWLLAIMPDMERQDIYDQWTDPNPRVRQAVINEPPFLDFMTCPSDPPLQKVALTSYVANAGLDEEDAAGCGVLHTALPIRGRRGKKIIHQRTTVDKIASGDGASNTILLTENIQASTWNGLSFFDESVLNQEMVPSPKSNSGEPPHNVVVWGNHGRSEWPAFQINSKNPSGGEWSPTAPPQLINARPSSEHRGGVNVAFADGHVQFVKDSIEYEVYALLMSPDGKKCAKDLQSHGHGSSSQGVNQLRVLTDTDYK